MSIESGQRPHALTWKQFSATQEKRSRKYRAGLLLARTEIEGSQARLDKLLDRIDTLLESTWPLPLIAPLPPGLDRDTPAEGFPPFTGVPLPIEVIIGGHDE